MLNVEGKNKDFIERNMESVSFMTRRKRNREDNMTFHRHANPSE